MRILCGWYADVFMRGAGVWFQPTREYWPGVQARMSYPGQLYIVHFD